MMYEFYKDNEKNVCDISGSEYLSLMEFCFRHSRYLALSFLHGFRLMERLECLEPYLFKSYETDDEPWYVRGPSAKIKIYRCTEWFKEKFLRHANSLFSWDRDNNNPEDLAFFREDGSAVLELLTHEGIVMLYNQSGEYVPDFVKEDPWEYRDDEIYVPVVWTAKRICDQHIPRAQKQELAKMHRIKGGQKSSGYRKKKSYK